VQKPRLKDVTLCAADCLNPGLAGRALARSAAECGFGDAVLFTDKVVEGPFRLELIPALRSREDYSRFVLRELHRHVTTPFVLIVQWDGYVLDGRCWSDAFLSCDYIGAKWPWHESMRVGNGGFSLRSTRLLELTSRLPADVETATNEDELICRVFRNSLETEHGVVFAPEALADQFAYERAVPDRPTFGFHGMFNLWRFASDEDVREIAADLHDQSTLGLDFLECALAYWAQRRFAPLAALYGRWRRTMTLEDVQALMQRFGATPETMAGFLDVAEAAISVGA
jgi:hypothetical protein